MLYKDLLRGARGASQYTGLTERTIYHETAKGRIPHTRIGRAIYYRKSDLDRLFDTEAAA